MRIFLADLGHNQLTVSSDTYPLGIANLATYLRAHLGAEEAVDVTLFREPHDLKAALDSGPPDVLGVSSYSWNHNLSRSFARYAKGRRPEMLVVMGGPNFPLTADVQERFLREMPEVDVAVRGPTYEGERAFVNVIRRYREAGLSLDGLQEGAVSGNLWIHRRTGEFVAGAEVERILDLDEIPSPYLAGLLDPFLTTGYFPLMQIARGCPFSCAFCNSSPRSNSKIYSHSLDNVKADLLYLAERVRPEMPLCFADDNFGMYALDEEVADYISYLQDRYHWPHYIRTTTGKNQAERIIRVMRKIRGGLPMTSAVQSLNPVVLKNISRSNISLDGYAKIQEEVQAQGMQSYGELILCLPGETKESFLKAVHDLMEAGVKRVSAHQLMLLHGAPLSTPESRAKFGFRTLFRVVARNIGDYLGDPAIETEEMVVQTPTFSFEDYLEARVFHLLLTIYYYEGNYDEAFQYARQHGVKPFDLIRLLQAKLGDAPEAFRRLLDDFRRESEEELFPTAEACAAWARDNFDALVEGTAGGNLLSKYSMLGRFYLAAEGIDFLERGIGDILATMAEGADEGALRAVTDYLRSSLLRVPFAQSLAATPRWNTRYDVETWRADGYSRRLEEYRLPEPVTFVMSLDDQRKRLIENRIATFGEHPSGLGKFTRTLFANDLRRTPILDLPPPERARNAS